jgi:hypothetical protein
MYCCNSLSVLASLRLPVRYGNAALAAGSR